MSEPDLETNLKTNAERSANLHLHLRVSRRQWRDPIAIGGDEMGEQLTRCFRIGRLTASLAVVVIVASGGRATAQVPGARHVVIIGVDGLSPDGIRKATTPTLHRMMKAGTSRSMRAPSCRR